MKYLDFGLSVREAQRKAKLRVMAMFDAHRLAAGEKVEHKILFRTEKQAEFYLDVVRETLERLQHARMR